MSDQELQLILLIRDYPLVTAEQLQRLTGRPWLNAIERSLLKLIKVGYLQRNKRENINTKYVYALTRKAIRIKEIGGRYADLAERKYGTIPHEMLINEVHMHLRESVVTWKQGRELWKCGIQPDGLFQLHQESVRRSFFLEAERQTNNVQFFREKIEGYIKLRETEGYRQFGLNQFTVLTVVLDEDHAQSLAYETALLIPRNHRKLYLFSTVPITNCILPFNPKWNEHPPLKPGEKAPSLIDPNERISLMPV